MAQPAAAPVLTLGQAPAALGSSGSDMVVTDRHTDASTGVTYTYLRQAIGGIEVIGTESLVATNRAGRVVVSHDRRARGIGGAAAPGNAAMSAEPRLSAEQAVVAAARALGLSARGAAPLRTLSVQRRADRTSLLSGGGLSQRDIPARLVYVLGERGGVRLAWDLSILETSGDHWWSVQVDATTGALLRQDDWVSQCAWGVPGEAPHSHEDHTDLVASTASAALAAATGQTVFGQTAFGQTAGARAARPLAGAYRVVGPPSEAPSFDARVLVADPSDPSVSPLGWHNDGTTAYTTTRGNNVYAYEDADNNNLPGYSPDGGAGLAFDFAFDDATMTPTAYRDAAITNTFFWSNHLHDVLARLGFDEAAGNFQTTNPSGTGLGGDALLAEALDGGGTNNANFATPPDGQAPRMQMFQWTSSPAQFTVNTPVALAGDKANGTASFGAQTYDLTSDLVLGLDEANASGATTTDACTALLNNVAGKIVLVDRGNCVFTVKATNAQNAGAIGLAVADNVVAAISGLAGTDPAVTIPAVRLLKTDGDAIKAQMGAGATVNVRMARAVRINRTSDMDAGVLAHEYGHGLSTRLTGGPANSSCLNTTTTQEHGGEGWSDFLALMTTMRPGDTRARSRGVGSYLFYQATTGLGIRPARYSPDFGVNAYTYASTNNTALTLPHGIGFVWATMLWDLAWDLMDAHGIDPSMTSEAAGNVIAMRLVIDGLKLQPCNPGFVDARDAILAADQLRYNGAHRTAIWSAFARRGLGASARQGLSSSRTDQTEAFDLPYDLLGALKVAATAADEIANGEFLTVTLTATNGTGTSRSGVVVRASVPDSSRFVAGSASNGGALAGSVVSFPAVTLGAGETAVRTFKVQARANVPRQVLFSETAEGGFGAWTRANTGGTNWGPATVSGYAGGNVFFAPNLAVSSELILTTAAPVVLPAGAELRFSNYYETEFAYDGGVVEVSTNAGATWTSLTAAFIQNGYNADIRPSTESPSVIAGTKAFSGYATDFLESVANLGAYAGQSVLVRFRAGSDSELNVSGWAIDNIEIVKATTLVTTPTVEGAGAPLYTGASVRTDVVAAPPTSPVAAGLPASVSEARAPGVSTRVLTLQNPGTVPLTWFAEAEETTGTPSTRSADGAATAAAAPAWLAISPQNGTVPAGGSQQITLQYNTTTLPNGLYESDVTVYSNDGAAPALVIPLAFTVDSALPVELVAFTAVSDGQGGVVVRWTTASETDNAGFAIEARDGTGPAASAGAWRELAFVAGAGTTSEARVYTRTLAALTPGPKQFRLRQVDLDGTVAYSAAVEALVGMAEAYRLADARPNPARTSARIDLVARESQNVRVAVYDVQGREVAVLHDGPVEALQTLALTVDAGALPSGVYLVRASGPQFTGVRRLTVVR